MPFRFRVWIHMDLQLCNQKLQKKKRKNLLFFHDPASKLQIHVNSHTKSKRHCKRLYKRLYQKALKGSMKTQSVALVARILVKTQPFRTTGEKGSMKTQSVALVARILVKTQPIRTTGEKGSMKTQSVALVARILWNTAYSHDRWKRLYENTEPLH